MDDPAALAVDLVADLDAALGRPRRLDGRRPAVLEAEDRDRVVLAGGLVAVAERRAPGEDLADRRVLADDEAGGLDAVAAHVEERAAAGRLGIPEVGGVRTRVTLARAHREDPPERARGDHLGDLHDLRAEDLVLEVAVEDAGLADEPEHLRRLVARSARAASCTATPLPPATAARTASRWRWFGRAMTTRSTSGSRAQAVHRVVRPLDPVACGERVAALAAGRGAGHDPGARHVAQPGQVVVRDEPGSDEPEADLVEHQ